MRDQALGATADSMPDATRGVLWILLVTLASFLFSLALACAAPFAALAALAGTRLPGREALALVGGVWLINQGIGYLLLGYPLTWDSFAWGGVIGLAALLAASAAGTLARYAAPLPGLAIAFLAAFGVFQAVLFAATAVLPAGAAAFSAAVVGEIFLINLLAFVGLLVLHHLALAAGLLVRARTAAGAAA